MPSSSDSPPQAFQYPPVQVDQSLSQLDLETLMMRSSTPQEEPSEVLEASNYDIVNPSEAAYDLISDDEAHTESLASTDCPPSDASLMSDDDDDYDTLERDLPEASSSVYRPLDSEPPEAEEPAAIDDSTHTESPIHTEDHEVHKRMPLRLEEHSSGEKGTIIGTHIGKSYQAQTGNWSHLFDRYDCADIRLVAKAGLAQDCIAPPDTYKIWYIGECEKWLANDISSQVAAALNASPSASRSIMVQGQLEPYGPVMNTHRCTNMELASEVITLIFEGGQNITFGPRKTLDRHDRPDLLVICHPTQSTSEKETHNLNCIAKYLKREERIPHLELIAAKPYGRGWKEYDSKSLVACVEGRNDSGADFELQEVMPLDHFTFFEIDLVQFNRHLALISPHLATPRVSSKPSRRTQESDTWKARLRDAFREPKALGYFASLATLFVCAPLMLALFAQKLDNAHLKAEDPSYAHSVCSSSLPTIAIMSQTIISVASVSTVKPQPNGLTLIPTLSKKSKGKCGNCKGKKVDEFMIHTAGDHSFTLFPSRGLTETRKKHQLQIQVTRNTEAVSIRFNRTIDGAYIVDLEQHYPHGPFNVSIATFSKPLLRQSFEIMMGHNKSTASELFDMAVLRYMRTQNKLREAGEHLLAKMQDIEEKADVWANDRLQESSGKVDAKIGKIKEMVKMRMGSGNDMLKKLPGTAWTGVRDATAPLRTSQSMLNARNNALRARCNLETAAGLSSSEPDGKKSWACAKVQG